MNDSRKSVQVLIVEDNPEDVENNRRLLESDPYQNYEIKNVETGKLGIEACREHAVDCILLDHHLPDMDSLEFLEKLFGRVSENEIGVVMMTGQGNDDIAHEAMNRGAHTYLNKNALTRGEVSRAIRGAIEMASIHQAHQLLMAVNYHDSLTGLGNRNMFGERLEESISAAADGGKFGVIILSPDGFSQIVDDLGRAAGDVTLRVFGMRLVSTLEPSDSVVRLGGDEFAVVTRLFQRDEQIISTAESLLSEIKAPFDFEGRLLAVGASVGVTICPDQGHDSDVLVRNADTAMYRARENGGGVVLHSLD